MSYSELHIFSMSTDGTLQVVSQKQFIAFENGDQPITSFNEQIDTNNMQVKLLFLTLRDGICELVEPLRINVDTHGFLDRRDHQIMPLPTKEKSILDGRHRFLNRFLNHSHQWSIRENTLSEAMKLSGMTLINYQNVTESPTLR